MKIRSALFKIRLLLNRLYPGRCAACGRLTENAALCPDCCDGWEREKNSFCVSCGRPQYSCACIPPLLAGKVSFARHVTAYPPRGGSTAGRTLLYLKRNNAFLIFDFLAEQLVPLIGEEITSPLTAVTNVPRSGARSGKYGVDPAAEIAKLCALKLGLEYIDALKSQNRPEQKKLGYARRLKNVEGAYRLKRRASAKINGRDVILIDDIITTGATMASCAAELTCGGAASIGCAAVAKTPSLQAKTVSLLAKTVSNKQ